MTNAVLTAHSWAAQPTPNPEPFGVDVGHQFDFLQAFVFVLPWVFLAGVVIALICAVTTWPRSRPRRDDDANSTGTGDADHG